MSARKSRERKRLSNAEFDQLLSLGETKKVSLSEESEGQSNLLHSMEGGSGGSSSPDSSPSSPAAALDSMQDEEAHSQLPRASSSTSSQGLNLSIEPIDVRRRSMYRSPGTASSPDLATLVRRTKEARAAQQPQGMPPALTTIPSRDQSESSLAELSYADTSRSSTGMTALSMASSNRNNRRQSSAAGSFVVVPEAKDLLPLESATNPRSLPKSDSFDFSTSTVTIGSSNAATRTSDAETISSSGHAHPPSPSTNSRSFSSTMRKTSGFFRKRFGGPSASNQTGSNLLHSQLLRSAPSSPTASSSMRTRTSTAPPMPTMSASYASATHTLDARQRSASASSPPYLDARPLVEASPQLSEDERLSDVLRSVDWDSLAQKLDTGPASTMPEGLGSGPFDDMHDRPALAVKSEPDVPARASSRAKRRSSGVVEQIQEEDATTPSIRLVPSPRPSPSIPPESSSLQPELESMGLGLQSIREAKSKESISSNATATQRKDSAVRTPSGGSVNSQNRSEFSNTQDSAIMPTSNNSPVLPIPSSSKASNRHSVVGYGSLLTKSNGSTVSLGQSRNSSNQAGASESLAGSLLEDSDANGLAAATKCWDEDPSFLKKSKIAEFLGGSSQVNGIARVAYMQHFNFKGLRLDKAFRKLCEKLYLKAETQQVDRILDEFSRHYWNENQDSIFGGSDLSTRMTSKQFVRNTMSTVQAQTSSTIPSHMLRRSSQENSDSALSTPTTTSSPLSSPPTEEPECLQDTSQRTASDKRQDILSSAQISRSNSTVSSRAMVNMPLPPTRARTMPISGQRGWEGELEGVLKEMYADIKAHPVYQPMSTSSASLSPAASPYGTWTGSSRGGSKQSLSLGSNTERTSTQLKRASIRGFLGPSQESFRASSPTPSTVTSFSDGNSTAGYGSNLTTATSILSPSTIGFASNLSKSIIKEAQEDDTQSDSGASTSDEELALTGAPWAKEGILQRKHYWETPTKRAKDKSWTQAFVVISKGEFKMFKFGDLTRGSSGAGGFGGGNWLASAQGIGDISLLHCLTSAMPPPGYSSDRPHVFVLTLASGSSYFFQAGTADLVQEWVSTANYWAARLSKEPLSGGVSNMEHGWNRVMPTPPIPSLPEHEVAGDDLEDLASVRSGKSGRSNRSGRSGRSRFSHRGSMASFGTSSNNINDRITISDWRLPQTPSTASTLSEEAQLKSLRKHCRYLQSELETHNELRGPMSRMYSMRSINAAKSTANWERKSKFLLSEIVKYTTYVHALAESMKLRQGRTGERTVARLLRQADEYDENDMLQAVATPQTARDTPLPLGDVVDTGDHSRKEYSTASLASEETSYYDVES